jgi:predicted dehydrogenase
LTVGRQANHQLTTSPTRQKMNDTINWGIIAPGRIAHKFAHDLQLAEGARLHAVASRSLERARAFAGQYGAHHAYGSYEEILACPDLDVVYIASPHTEHCAHTLMCLKQKIPVLCEKPMAINIAQAHRMVEAARANDTFLMDAIWTRFIPAFEEALQLLNDGIIGSLKTIRADFGFRAEFPPEHRLFNMALGGGSLLDVGIYPVFLATLLWGKPEKIKASAAFGPTGSDDSCAMIFEYAGGRLAILDASVAVNTNTEAYFYGETGTLHLHSRFHHPSKFAVSYYEKPTETFNHPFTGNGYYHEILEVCECLKNGKKESEKLPLDFSLQLMEVLDWARREAGIVYRGIDGND